MKKNIGKVDRTVRFIVGGVVIAAGIYFQNWWGAVGLLPIATGLMAWCPSYELFGADTHHKHAKQH